MLREISHVGFISITAYGIYVETKSKLIVYKSRYHITAILQYPEERDQTIITLVYIKLYLALF